MPIHGMGFRFGAPDWPMTDLDDFIGRLDVLDQNRIWAGVVADYYWDTTPTPVTIPYAWLSPPFRSRADQPINDPAVSVQGGGTAYSPNAASIARYGDFGLPVTLTTSVPADADALAAYLSANYSDFRMRCPSLTVNLLNAQLQPTDVQTLLGVKIGDRILISDAPATWPQGNNALVVEGIAKQVLIDRCRLITFNTSPVVMPSGPYLPFTPINANSTFETGVNSWAGVNNATLASSSTQVHSGLLSMSVTPDGVSGSPSAYSAEFPVIPGVTYGYSEWLWSTASFSYNAVLQFNNSAHGFVSNSITGATVGPSWTQASGSAVAPSTAAYGQLQIIAAGTPAGSNILYVDDAMVFPLSRFFRWGSSVWAGPDSVPF